jgi:hypothetical protein
MIAGSPCARDGLGEQWPGVSWVNEGVAVQILHEAGAEQDIIAQLAGALDGFPPGGQSPLRLAGEVASEAEGGERFDEQPAGAELTGELDRLVT